MPEIIQFSNNNFYTSEPLIPLRQYGSARLDPVVNAVYVEDGYREGKYGDTINRPEAQAIVQKISECCSDPDYEDRTMGVITLLGNKQARLIEELLVKELDATEIEERKITVGVPYTFQGDERDVIFLSMVDAPEGGKRCRAMTDQEQQRVFNVAASRAKDQMWLFHSATLNDLRPDCLRYKLLSHCLNPRVEQPDIEGISVQDLRTSASDSIARAGSPPAPFDSWFEVDVFLDIVSRGYRVLPQYQVNPFRRGYRIDLVVEGIKGRLAVECDGDEFHGAEEFESDMQRQRELERCGWRFWRVRGGAYNRDKEAALESLWKELERRHIYPEGHQPEPRDQPRSTNGGVTTDRSAPAPSTTVPEGPAADTDMFAAKEERLTTVPQRTSTRSSASRGSSQHVVPAKDMQQAIIAILQRRPNCSIALKALTKEVCKELSIITRGNPRKELDKRIRRSVGVLKRKQIVKEYKARNVRIKLVDS